MRYNYFLIYFIFLITMCGCKKEAIKMEDPIVAQVLKKTLKLSELREAIPLPVNKKDSELVAHDYIDSWIKQQLLVSEAESKLTQKEQKLDREIEIYREELLIQRYKDNIIQPIISQEITKSEIDRYYQKNISRFILTAPIVKVNYIIFPTGVTVPENILNILASNKGLDIEKFEDYVFKFAKKYDDFEDNWIYLENLLNSIKYSLTDIDDFLKAQKIISKKIGDELHIIAIKSYYLAGNKAPIEFVEPQIKGTIINNKKIEFFREIKDSLYKDALKYKKFKVNNSQIKL